MFGLGKSKSVVGLDIGSSAVKAVELKASGQELQGRRHSRSSRCRLTASSTAPSSTAPPSPTRSAASFENKAFKTKEVAASLSGNAVIVKKISLPVMTEAGAWPSRSYWEAEQYIPFDIQDVNLDYQILDAGTGADSKGTMDVLLVAAKKRKDRRLHRRHLAGRPRPGHRRRRRLRAAERLRGQLRPRARRGRRPAQRRRQRHQHQHPAPATSRRSPRDISIGGNVPTPKRCRRSSTCRSTAPSS